MFPSSTVGPSVMVARCFSSSASVSMRVGLRIGFGGFGSGIARFNTSGCDEKLSLLEPSERLLLDLADDPAEVLGTFTRAKAASSSSGFGGSRGADGIGTASAGMPTVIFSFPDAVRNDA